MLQNESLNTNMCQIPPEVLEKIKKFRFRRGQDNAALLLKINMNDMQLVIEDELEEIESIDELQNELPESQPRFLIYSCRYERSDGRVQYPLVFIFVSPSGGSGRQMMAYAGSRNQIRDACGITKVFEVRELEEMTQEWLTSKLSFF